MKRGRPEIGDEVYAYGDPSVGIGHFYGQRIVALYQSHGLPLALVEEGMRSSDITGEWRHSIVLMDEAHYERQGNWRYWNVGFVDDKVITVKQFLQDSQFGGGPGI